MDTDNNINSKFTQISTLCNTLYNPQDVIIDREDNLIYIAIGDYVSINIGYGIGFWMTLETLDDLLLYDLRNKSEFNQAAQEYKVLDKDKATQLVNLIEKLNKEGIDAI